MLSSKSSTTPAPLQLLLPATNAAGTKFVCRPDVMGYNLKSLQALKWDSDGVKFRPYNGLKILLHPAKPIDNPHPPQGETKTVSQTALLSSFLMDKQLHKMIQLQTPLSVGSTMFRDILTKIGLVPLVKKHLMQATYLEIAFLQVRPTESKAQRTIQKDLEMKTIQSVTTAVLRALPKELFSRVTFDEILESSSTVEVEQRMDVIASKMKWKTCTVAQ